MLYLISLFSTRGFGGSALRHLPYQRIILLPVIRLVGSDETGRAETLPISMLININLLCFSK